MKTNISISRAIKTTDVNPSDSNGLGYPLVTLLTSIVGRSSTITPASAVVLRAALNSINRTFSTSGVTTALPAPITSPIVGDTVAGNNTISNVATLDIGGPPTVSVTAGWLLNAEAAGFPAGTVISSITPGPAPYTITMSNNATVTSTGTSFSFLVGPPYNQVTAVPTISNGTVNLAASSPAPWYINNSVSGMPQNAQLLSATGAGPYVLTFNQNATVTALISPISLERNISNTLPFEIDTATILGSTLEGAGVFISGPDGLVPFAVSRVSATLVTQKALSGNSPFPGSYTENYDSFNVSASPVTRIGSNSLGRIYPVQYGGVTASGVVQNIPGSIANHVPTAIGNIVTATCLQNFSGISFDEQAIVNVGMDTSVSTVVAPDAVNTYDSFGTLTLSFDIDIPDTEIIALAGRPLYLVTPGPEDLFLTYTWNTGSAVAQRYVALPPSVVFNNQALVTAIPTPATDSQVYSATLVTASVTALSITNTTGGAYDYAGCVTTVVASNLISAIPSLIGVE